MLTMEIIYLHLIIVAIVTILAYLVDYSGLIVLYMIINMNFMLFKMELNIVGHRRMLHGQQLQLLILY
jgi:hypothetical protein